MKIQSCTAKILKYPALATLVALAGTAWASDKPTPMPSQPEENPTPRSGPEATPPDSGKTEEEEIPEPQYYLGEIYPEPKEEEPKKPRPTVIPQDAVGSVPRPEE